jgi:hypothetical protein
MTLFSKNHRVKRTDARVESEVQRDSQSGTFDAINSVNDPGTEPLAVEETTEVEATVVESLVPPAVIGPTVVEPAIVEPTVVEPAAAEAKGSATASNRSQVAGAMDLEAEDIEPEPVFGIADAIHLMRSLPSDPNIDLVVRVVRVTLDAVDVSVEEIVADARRKEKRIEDSVAVLEGEVAELEKQIYARRCAIAAHKADLEETADVRERLYQADKYNAHRPPPTPPDAARVPPPRSADWGDSDHGKGH